MNKIIRAVIFDMDGVVIDTKPLIEEFWQKHAQSFGFQITDDQMNNDVHGCPVWLTCERLFPQMTKQDIDVFIESVHLFEENLFYEPVNGIKSWLKKLQQHQVKVGLVTSSFKKKVEKVFNDLSLNDYFQFMVTADMISEGKPHPEPYLKASEIINEKPEQCLVFEDSVSGIISATQAGMNTVGINSTSMTNRLMDIGAKAVIPDFTEIILSEKSGDIEIILNGRREAGFGLW